MAFNLLVNHLFWLLVCLHPCTIAYYSLRQVSTIVVVILFFIWTYFIDTVDTRVSRYFQNQKNVFLVREKRAQFTPVHGVMVPVNTQELLFFSSAQI